ncbi:MAG TPA: sigma-70 family RNA polymerase sigma factor, partial [Sphingomicrobium sp.]|nr:sigma-70 family RNA polymerase sigma factor [Sphingomicrobium sp.]
FQVLDETGTPEETLLARDELQRLGETVADMPARVREVFVLRRIEGLSQRGVAERLGISVSTVEKHLAKAMLRLSDAIARGGKRKSQASKGSEVNEWSNDAARN